jgi:hypothetical protein
MTATSTAARGATAPTKQCPCGCAPCKDGRCELDCLTRPKFFCGQVLTDADLTALVKWTRGRLGLGRFRYGWGVVCGLDVHCAPDDRAAVIVEPGYAVDCCGEDVVVCAATPVRVGDPDSDDCREPWATAEPDAEVVAVDLAIRFKERPTDAKLALNRGSCTDAGACEFSRIEETFEPMVKPVVGAGDPVARDAERWTAAYDEALGFFDLLRDAELLPFAAGNAAAIRRWLQGFLIQYPPRQFPFVADWLRNQTFDLADEVNLAKVLFWIAQDRRSTLLACACPACEHERGVPLARIWLRKDAGGGRVVVGIDAVPPYRRPLHDTCWPAPLGQVNLGRVLWHRTEEACSELRELGVELNPDRSWKEWKVAEVEALVRTHPIAPCDRSVTLRYLDPAPNERPFTGRRVVGFTVDMPSPEPARALVNLVKWGPASVTVGEGVTFDYRLDVELLAGTGMVHAVEVEDPLPPGLTFRPASAAGNPDVVGTPESGQLLRWALGSVSAGQSLRRQWTVTVAPGPVELSTVVTNYVRLRGLEQGEPGPREWHSTTVQTTIEPSPVNLLRIELQELEGIGAKYQNRLEQAGITTVPELAATTVAFLQPKFPRLKAEELQHWIDQASALARRHARS